MTDQVILCCQVRKTFFFILLHQKGFLFYIFFQLEHLESFFTQDAHNRIFTVRIEEDIIRISLFLTTKFDLGLTTHALRVPESQNGLSMCITTGN